MDCTDLLVDWIEFCEGRRDFDESHFYCLLMDDPPPTDPFLNSVLSFFPARLELLHRVKVVKHPALLVKAGDLDDPGHDRIISLACKFLAEMAKVCEAAGEAKLAAEAASAEVIYCDDTALVEAKLRSETEPQCELNDMVGDHLRSFATGWKAKEYALAEAFYGLTTSHELCWYLEAPMRSHRFDFEPYAHFWALGGTCALTTDGFLVSRK